MKAEGVNGMTNANLLGRVRAFSFCILVAGMSFPAWRAWAAESAPPASFSAAAQSKPGSVAGFIPRDQLIDSLALLPAPAAEGSDVQVADDLARKAAIALRGSPRWDLAARDADYKSPKAVDAFACATGINISEAETPRLYALLRRSLIDAGLATYKAKDRYNRTRPFVAAKDDVICSPADREMLVKDGSYPSGHAAFGWAWALILAEMIPDKADVIIQRGYDFGQSRVACGVHWQSDVNAGRLVGAAVVAQLHANAGFVTEFGAAKGEVAAARAAGKPGPDCSLERASGR